ncbi:MAG: hypothetical protein FJX84_05175 [Bacteroidetes bacterium]|nr:hypothetical protein [Bacteroidota bacterium]
MRIVLSLILIIFVSFPSIGQRVFKKGEVNEKSLRKDAKIDKLVMNYGIQFNFGPAYLMTGRTKSYDIPGSSGLGGNYEVNPAGRLGFNAEFGFTYFPLWKGTPIPALKKSRILDYIEGGVGFKQLGGKETIGVDYDNQNPVSENGIGKFRNNFVYMRTSFHSIVFVGKAKIDKSRKYYIDNALGINLDVNVVPGNKLYDDPGLSFAPPTEFHNPFVAQLNYCLGFGIRLDRAWMFIPTINLPVIGFYEWNGVNAKMNWFSSEYWPIQLSFKFMKLREKNRSKCKGARINHIDKQLLRELEKNN